MAKVMKRTKALSVSPLKASQTIGASIAFLGIDRSIPMMHGSQGCTAFGKVFFVRHFREPIPLQTTAMDHASSVLGADENVVLGLKAICEKSKPALIGLPTTGLAETQGCDVQRNVAEFRQRFPQFDNVRVVPVNTPDYSGSFEKGYAAAVTAMIDQLVPSSLTVGNQPSQINVLVTSALTIGDMEWIKETIEAFGLKPIVLPDLSTSLDGHLTGCDFSPVSVGGMPVECFESLGESIATVVIGPSLSQAADLLHERTGVPDHRFDHLLGLEATDQFVAALMHLSSREVPRHLSRQRSQLQDTMLDTHFMLGQARVAIAADPDLLFALSDFLIRMGAKVVAAVAPSTASVLERVPTEAVQIGDLEDLELLARAGNAELLISNSHAVALANRLKLPLLRAGFPQYDLLGGYQRCWIGYRASRQTLFDLANTLTGHRDHCINPYRSIYSQKQAPPTEKYFNVLETTNDDCESSIL